MKSLLRDIWDGFRAQPSRTGFCVLAVAVGATTLSLLVAILGSLESTSRRLVSELGANTIVALPEPVGETIAASSLDQSVADLVQTNFPELLVATVSRSEARTLGSDTRLQVVATGSQLASARGWSIVAGRFIDEHDLSRGSRHAVITRGLSTELSWQLGHVIMLADVPFVVVGIVRTQGGALSGQFGNPDLALGERLVFVPHTVPAMWSESSSREAEVDAIFIQVPGAEPPGRVVRALQGLLEDPTLSVGQISWVTPETLVERIDRLKTVIGGAVAVISLLSLILGGTTLMSLMVTNIRERVSEIGLRMTLGATRPEITALFVSESLALSLLGGFIGAAVGHLLIVLVDPMLPIALSTGSMTWAIPIATCVVSSLLFAYGPASRAARISPAAALRVE